MPHTFAAVLFDLDGVLIDSQAAIRRRWEWWAEQHNIPFEDVEAVFHGRPMAEVVEAVAPHLDVETEKERMARFTEDDAAGLTAFEDAASLLHRLPDERWTIATSGRRRTATTRMRQTNLPIPDTLVTADDVAHGKPAPDPYRLAAKRLGVAPARCLAIEDAPAGIRSAQRAGATVVAIASTSSPDALTAATAVLPHLRALQIDAQPDGTLAVQWSDAERA